MRARMILFFLMISTGILAAEPTGNDLLTTIKSAGYLSAFEKEVVYEINLFRSDPAKYSENYIAPLAENYKGRILHFPGQKPIMTREGVRALTECVRELKKASPVSLVYPNAGLSKAADDHVADQSRSGKTGHTGRDRSGVRERIERYGKWQSRIAENIAYGGFTARQVVVLLLIDDNVPGRGHRKTFLQPDFKTVGVSAGSHPEYLTMCVMDFAGGFLEK